MEQQKGERFGSSFREGLDAMFIIANVHATCLTPFLRCNLGTNVPGFAGVGALVLLVLMVAGSSDQGMVTYLLFWLSALMYQRARTYWLVGQGWRAHSQYEGTPWLAMLFPFVKTEDRAKSLEPLICFVVGPLLCPLSPTVGTFVLFGLVSLSIVRGIQLEAIRRQVTAMQDLEFEQRALSERIRARRNDF